MQLRAVASMLSLITGSAGALRVVGVEVPHARPSPAASALEGMLWPAEFPYDAGDLTPDWSGKDQLFYLYPKFVQHAGAECRAGLTDFYKCVLPKDGDVLDLCSSFTSHYPADWKARRCVALGLNPLELIFNPSKTEWVVRNLNEQPTLPFADESFDLITNSLSVDYMTQPIELFQEIHRVLKPGGLACCAFTNRCFPTKVVPGA